MWVASGPPACRTGAIGGICAAGLPCYRRRIGANGLASQRSVGLPERGSDVGPSSTSRFKPCAHRLGRSGTLKSMIGSIGKFRDLLESAPDAMMMIDPDGKIALVNTQIERMFGYSRE